MPNTFQIDIDGAKMREALEGESLKAVIKTFIKAAARESADHVCAEAKARLLRQLSGTSTGETVDGIVVKSDRTGWGWIVSAGNMTTPQLDFWLNYGTKFMTPREFFYSAAKLEAAAHRERIQNAVQRALSEYGLGSTQAAA